MISHLTLSKKEKTLKESQMLEGVTPLHLAACSGNSEAVHWLLNHRANPEARTERERDVLSFAAQSQAAHSMLELFAPFQIAHRLENVFSAIIETL